MVPYSGFEKSRVPLRFDDHDNNADTSIDAPKNKLTINPGDMETLLNFSR